MDRPINKSGKPVYFLLARMKNGHCMGEELLKQAASIPLTHLLLAVHHILFSGSGFLSEFQLHQTPPYRTVVCVCFFQVALLNVGFNSISPAEL